MGTVTYHPMSPVVNQEPFNPPDTMPEWVEIQIRNAFATRNVEGIIRLNRGFSNTKMN